MFHSLFDLNSLQNSVHSSRNDLKSLFSAKLSIWSNICGNNSRILIRQLQGVKLLILDNVGKERPSEHTHEVYFYVVDEHYDERAGEIGRTDSPPRCFTTISLLPGFVRAIDG